MTSNEMTIQEARAKLGDLVIAAMRGETTVITRYGKPAARIVPITCPRCHRALHEHLCGIPHALERDALDATQKEPSP